MAYPYYSGYPMGLYQPAQNQYQPMMNQPMMNQPQSQPPQNQQANGGIIWVQGEEGAKAYLVAPGESRLLLDSEGNHFYLKSTDIQGMPQPLRVFDYVERTGQRQPAQAASVQAEELCHQAGVQRPGGPSGRSDSCQSFRKESGEGGTRQWLIPYTRRWGSPTC